MSNRLARVAVLLSPLVAVAFSCHLVAGLDGYDKVSTAAGGSGTIASASVGASAGAGPGGAGGQGAALVGVADHYGDGQAQREPDVASTANGDALLVGIFNGSMNFGQPSSPVNATMPDRLFMAKIHGDLSGADWARRVDSTMLAAPHVASGPNDGFAIAGVLDDGSVDFGNTVVRTTDAGAGSPTAFVAGYDPAGLAQWAYLFAGDGSPIELSSVSGDGTSVLVTGSFQGTFLNMATTYMSTGGYDGLVAVLDALSGTPIWLTTIGGTMGVDHMVAGGGMDASGISYVAGSHQGVTDVGGCMLGLSGVTRKLFVISYDQAGTETQCRDFGPGPVEVSAVAVAANGEVAVAGKFGTVVGGSIQFGGSAGTLMANGSPALFVAKLSSTLAPQWARAIPLVGESGALLRDLAIDPQGTIYAAGFFRGSVPLDNGTLMSAGAEDVLALVMSNDGSTLEGSRFGSALTDMGTGVALTSTQILITGHFSGTIDFGTGPLTATGSAPDVFLVAFPLGQ